jgi:hypothetical protein
MRAFPIVSLFACLGFLLYLGTETQAAPKSPVVIETPVENNGLKVSISAPYKLNERLLTLQSNPHINVLLQNTSSKPINVFEAWNGWGFNNLTLEVTKIDGKVLDAPLTITKGRLSLTENYPSTETIGPGETLVREVLLYVPPKIWNPASQEPDSIPNGSLYLEFPFPVRGARRQITLKALFEIQEESQGEKLNVWTGKIASPPLDYQVFWD